MITPQRIIDILEERYAELTGFLEAEGPDGDLDQIEDFQSRLNEIEVLLDRIYTDTKTEEMLGDRIFPHSGDES